MPILLAFTMGFILKAVGPGLVVPAMFKLQRQGLGRDQGEPELDQRSSMVLVHALAKTLL